MCLGVQLPEEGRLELELQRAVSHLMWVMGSKLSAVLSEMNIVMSLHIIVLLHYVIEL